jgi:hypothetical protein
VTYPGLKPRGFPYKASQARQINVRANPACPAALIDEQAEYAQALGTYVPRVSVHVWGSSVRKDGRLRSTGRRRQGICPAPDAACPGS